MPVVDTNLGNYDVLFDHENVDDYSAVFKEKVPEPLKIPFSWSWVAKYRDRYSQEWRGISTGNPSHEGIYSPTGSGKTFFHNAKIEVSAWAHDNSIILNDRKMDSVGFLLPQDQSLMSNAKFFTNPRTGEWGIRPEPMPKENFHLWLPATYNSFYDDLIEELIDWGVVHFFRFHPKAFLETTAGDFLSKSVGMTMIESQATTQALSMARGAVGKKQIESWSIEGLQPFFDEQEQLTGRSHPYEKLLLMALSGVCVNDKKVEIIHKRTGERRTEPVEVISNLRNFITGDSQVHVFCNRYMSSAVADNTLSMAISYILFSILKEDCEMIPKKRRVFCHLPEAQYSFSRNVSETIENAIKGYFSNSYIDGMRETRQYQLYHMIDTQQVKKIPEDITANQLRVWLMPGFQHPSELNWLQSGIGRSHMNEMQMHELFAMRDPFENRGKAFYVGPDIATPVWTRPRQTFHFQEGSDPANLLKSFRLNYDNAEKWKRWDE